MAKLKVCKGTGKAKGFGCDKPLPYSERNGIKSYKATYGLGHDCRCYTNWLIGDSPEAKDTFDKLLIKNKKDLQTEQKKAKIKENKLLKNKLESKSSLEKKLEKEVNTIVRYIDKGHGCVSSGRPLGNDTRKFDAGHLFTVKANPTIRFNLFNIYGQSIHDNRDKSGNEIEYFLRLETVFSKELQDFTVKLKQIQPLHLTKDELRDKTQIARSLIKWLKLQDRIFTNEERISLRNDFNNKLAIYPQEFCEFKLKNYD